MSIGNIPYHVFPSIGSAFSASYGDRVSLPVAPSAYLYSHFRHVAGVPAPEGVQGISVSQLKILDSLISEIVRLNQQPKPNYNIQNEDPEKQYYALVENLQEQVRQAELANESLPFHAAAVNSGILFSISA